MALAVSVQTCFPSQLGLGIDCSRDRQSSNYAVRFVVRNGRFPNRLEWQLMTEAGVIGILSAVVVESTVDGDKGLFGESWRFSDGDRQVPGSCSSAQASRRGPRRSSNEGTLYPDRPHEGGLRRDRALRYNVRAHPDAISSVVD